MIKEVIGPAPHACLRRPTPVDLKQRVRAITAFGGFDEGEIHPGGAGCRPINNRLKA